VTSTERYRTDPEYRARCIQRMREYHKRYRAEHGKSRSTVIYRVHRKYREKLAQTARLRMYGLTEQQYVAMLVAQNNCCAICKRVRHLWVDHDHETGQVRGLLCKHCNSAIGLLEDSIPRMEAALRYIKDAKYQ
jgi:uncharacterized protein YbaR (Trm112 family)